MLGTRSLIICLGMACLGFAIAQPARCPSLEEMLGTVRANAEKAFQGSKINNYRKAERTAFDAYSMRMKEGVSSMEAPGGSSIITLGYDVPGFGKEGQKVWEVRITEMTVVPEFALRSIVWIQPDTGDVHFVCGPWDDGE